MAEESKYAYDEESVKAIIDWAQTAQLPKEVTLSEAEHIFDTKTRGKLHPTHET